MKAIVAGLMVLMLAGCTANVVTDYTPAGRFGEYASWAYAPEESDSTIVSLDDTRVKAALERELKRKGLRQLPADEADLLVRWQIVEEERLEQSGVGLGFGFGSGHFGWGVAAPPPVREVKEGKLVVELVDTDTMQVVWRAASRRYLRESQSPESRRELIDEVVAEMFSHYPPGLD